MKDEGVPDLNTPGFEPGTQWSEIEYSTGRPSAPRYAAAVLDGTAPPDLAVVLDVAGEVDVAAVLTG